MPARTNDFTLPDPVRYIGSGRGSEDRHEGKALEEQVVYRLDPETKKSVEGMLRWGFIPRGVRKPSPQPIHARAETIAENEVFAASYRERRCVIPMNQFFLKDKNGRRIAFGLKDGSLFGVAGIWDNWRDHYGGDWIRTFAAITVEPNELVAPVHDRMLAILRKEDFPRWLGPEADPSDLLKPYPADEMKVFLKRSGRH